MRLTAIHLAPDDAFEDWIVRADDGREIGHDVTREAAELALGPMLRERKGMLVIHLPDGRIECRRFTRGWLAPGWKMTRLDPSRRTPVP
jgi:hypothetical protein